MKRSIYPLLLALILILAGCTAAPAQEAAPAPSEPAVSEASSPTGDSVPEMTLDELAKYNGKDGEKAYVAVDGIVYDVTLVPPWAGGIHQGKYQAGIDASSLINESPHGKKVLEKLTVVGKIKQ